MKTLIPKKAMAELNSLLQAADDDQIEFAKDESTLFFRVGSRLLTSRQLTGQFPNYEAVLPKEITRGVTLQCEEIASAIQRVAQFADERSQAIKLRLEKNELKVSSSSAEAGESEDTIETTYAADPLTIGFNSQYLLDFLKAAGSGEVRLEFKDPQSAGQLRPQDSSDGDFRYRYVVMPMRI
jgi:DNA polymerase-3 subunit beta